MVRHSSPRPALQPGDLVIVTQLRRRAAPSRRATRVFPEPRGEGYCFAVEKYWVVLEVMERGMAKFLTPRGKIRYLSTNNRNVRRASLWERLVHRHRFACSSILRDNQQSARESAIAS